MAGACNIQVSETQLGDTQTSKGSPLQIDPGFSVIIAEDDPVLRSLFSEALIEKGLQVLIAADGLEALRLYRENADRVWLVISDVIMPGIDGLTAAVEMRKINDKVSFLFMSGRDFRRIGVGGIKIEEIPNSNFFLKPFAFKEVITKIQTMKLPHR
jgi:DNA-binding response OmpR family regulator